MHLYKYVIQIFKRSLENILQLIFFPTVFLLFDSYRPFIPSRQADINVSVISYHLPQQVYIQSWSGTNPLPCCSPGNENNHYRSPDLPRWPLPTSEKRRLTAGYSSTLKEEVFFQIRNSRSNTFSQCNRMTDGLWFFFFE